MKITVVKLAERVESWGQKLASLGVAHINIDSITISDDIPGKAGAVATVTVSEDYDHCRFWFNVDFIANASADDLDQTIIHEWMHVAMRDFDVSLHAVERWMPEATYDDFAARVDHEREGLVDRMATALFYAHKRRAPRFHP